MPENPYTIKFSAFERMKYDSFVKESEFKNLAELIREALSVYISNPDIRNPVKEPTKFDDALKGFDLYMDRKEREEQEVIELIKNLQERMDIMDNEIVLLMKKAGVSNREQKRAKKKDTSMEDIFGD